MKISKNRVLTEGIIFTAAAVLFVLSSSGRADSDQADVRAEKAERHSRVTLDRATMRTTDAQTQAELASPTPSPTPRKKLSTIHRQKLRGVEKSPKIASQEAIPSPTPRPKSKARVLRSTW